MLRPYGFFLFIALAGVSGGEAYWSAVVPV
jgi:hypothetical protein